MYRSPSLTPSSARAKVGTPSDVSPELSDNFVGKEEFQKYLAILSTRRAPQTVAGPIMNNEQQRVVYERIALYHIRASKVSSCNLSYSFFQYPIFLCARVFCNVPGNL
jgi:hypothetical protein